MAKSVTAPVSGKALLKKVQELSHLSRREVARRCGYTTTSRNGTERVNLVDFYDAVLVARGVPLEPESVRSNRGRELSYRVSVHKNGQILLGPAYTRAMRANPGDEFELKLGRKHIHLTQITGDDMDGEDLE